MTTSSTQAQREKFGLVAVLYGGQSAEREVSLRSGKAVHSALLELGIEAVLIDVGEDIVSQLQTIRPNRVFIALHGMGGEDGRMQALLEFMKIPYTGSGVQASALAMDKWFTKQIFRVSGVATPDYRRLSDDTDFAQVIAELGEGLMVKPSHEGSSIGMSKVTSLIQLPDAYKLAKRYDSSVFAERIVNGPEFTVAILGDEALPAIRLETDNTFYDYEAKYVSNDTKYICPCGLCPEDEKVMQTLALQAFASLGCSGWGRVDVMRDEDGQFVVLEVNTVPGMTDHSLVPMAAKARGYDFKTLVAKILAQTLV